MRADKIKTIIGNINDLPYKTILFDGTWGVGKSYAVMRRWQEIRTFVKYQCSE